MVYFYLFQRKICLCENDAIIQPYKMFPSQRSQPTVLSCSTYMSHSGIINKSSQISGITDPDELYQFIRRDAENGKFFCTICNLMGHPKRSNVRNHIECKHFKDAFIYSCDLCSYTSNTKDALQRHRRKHEPTNI